MKASLDIRETKSEEHQGWTGNMGNYICRTGRRDRKLLGADVGSRLEESIWLKGAPPIADPFLQLATHPPPILPYSFSFFFLLFLLFYFL